MKLSKYRCPWCETHRLHYLENWRGEVKLACRDPGEFNCPDTTGWCETEEEANGYAEMLPRISLAVPKGIK